MSTQYACHYAFESEAKLRILLENASKRLCYGGMFFGTIPNGEFIVETMLKKGERKWKTEYFAVEFSEEHWAKVKANPQLWAQAGATTPAKTVD